MLTSEMSLNSDLPNFDHFTGLSHTNSFLKYYLHLITYKLQATILVSKGDGNNPITPTYKPFYDWNAVLLYPETPSGNPAACFPLNLKLTRHYQPLTPF